MRLWKCEKYGDKFEVGEFCVLDICHCRKQINCYSNNEDVMSLFAITWGNGLVWTKANREFYGRKIFSETCCELWLARLVFCWGFSMLYFLGLCVNLLSESKQFHYWPNDNLLMSHYYHDLNFWFGNWLALSNNHNLVKLYLFTEIEIWW